MTIDPEQFPLDLDPKDRTYAALSSFHRSVLRASQDSIEIMNVLHGSDGSGNPADIFMNVGDPNDWLVEEEGTPSMKVLVNAGYGFVSLAPAILRNDFTTAAFVAPSGGNDRWDLVCWDAVTREIKIVTGVEGASPAVPDTPDDHRTTARIFLRDTMSVIKNVDDSTNGYIVDRRVEGT